MGPLLNLVGKKMNIKIKNEYMLWFLDKQIKVSKFKTWQNVVCNIFKALIAQPKWNLYKYSRDGRRQASATRILATSPEICTIYHN